MNRKIDFFTSSKRLVLTGVLLLLSHQVYSQELTVAFVDQPESNAKAQMLGHILEANTDYRVTLKETSLEDMWAGVAAGRYDASVSVIMPEQNTQMEQYSDRVEDLGPNWLGPDFSIHTIVREGLAKDDIKLARFLNNYCLCGERLMSVMTLNSDGEITRQEAIEWMAEQGPWITNMMGFVRPFDDREQRNVTY